MRRHVRLVEGELPSLSNAPQRLESRRVRALRRLRALTWEVSLTRTGDGATHGPQRAGSSAAQRAMSW